MINITALKTALRARLTGDATLMTLIGGVYSLAIPSTATWTKPNLELGVQAGVRDPANGYAQRGEDLRIRLMAHAKGSAPGVGSTDTLYAALVRADAVLLASPLTVSGHTVWTLERVSSIPEAAPVDESGYLRMQAGSLYRIRLV